MVDLSKVNFDQSMDAVIQRILAARGILSNEDIDHRLSSMPSPDEMRGMSFAIELLIDALKTNKNILILGDYDADGATASALAIRLFKAMGAKQIGFLVPNRFEYGYGLSPEIAEVALQMEPDLVITVDNGISSIEGVKALKDRGISVIVTDHHLPGEQLPNADAILNPNQPDCSFPSKNLAGVGVLFYLMVGLRASLRHMNWFADQGIEEPRLEDYLDLVALGTVADLVPLDRLNRVLVVNGLKLIASGKGNPGISALFEISGRELTRAKSMDLAFAIGPRINAAGRLDDISEGIRCLLADSSTEARELALDLHHTNLERRQIQDQMIDDAERIVEKLLAEQSGELPWGLCCYQADWHQGVVGLVASRLKETSGRPAIAFANANNEDASSSTLKGSARSIEGLHIRDLLDGIATKNPNLIQKFGGHAMAAGLSISAAQYPDFVTAFDNEVRSLCSEESLEQVRWSDGELPPDAMTLAFARQLESLLPWGQTIAEPAFHGEFTIESSRWLKEKHLKLSLGIGSGRSMDAIWFNAKPQSLLSDGSRIKLLYRLGVNEFRGRENLQLMVIDEISDGQYNEVKM